MDKYAKRKYVLGAVILLVAVVYVIKLLDLQVLDDTWTKSSESNAIRRQVNYPARGLIFDRNGVQLVRNKAAYNMMVVPGDLKPFDTLEFCRLLKIEPAELIDGIKKARAYSPLKPSVVVSQLSPEVYAGIQEKLLKYPGFYPEPRTLREYPRNIAAHMLGYVGEVDAKVIEQYPYYAMGDYIGITGLERSYEQELRGRKGVNFVLVDVHNRVKGPYQDGERDTMSVLGKDLTATIDAELQEYAELLMSNKRGAVVAIEPETGEVLCYLSVPSYNPNLLVGRERAANYNKLLVDSFKPLINRAIAPEYPPGSTFKLVNGLSALQMGAITTSTAFSCNGPASYPMKCTHFHQSPITIQGAIRESCNVFFMETLFRAVGLNKYQSAENYNNWRRHVMSFGLGQVVGKDFYGEKPGRIPSVAMYNQIYKGANTWNANTIRSLAIGQGEINVTPLQLANMAATIANHGWYIEPHLVKAVSTKSGEVEQLHFERRQTIIDEKHFEVVIQGMQDAVER
ncbi:MAG: penicillin-binding protein 2, partial [Bacteroidales bacterium]|nr:penicillin-binding protein 2 [Bacteroidales bacterium]